MAEMLVRVIDKYEGADERIKTKTTMRGDVIVVNPDGWPWSEIERTAAQWVILKVNATVEKCQQLRARELGDPITNPYLRILAFGLDLDALAGFGHAVPTAAAAKARAAARQPRLTEAFQIVEAQLDAVRFEKPKIQDPAVIG